MSENVNMPAVSVPAAEVHWRDPDWCDPPRGRKLLLLTEGGVAVIGVWRDDGGFTAWSPLPKRTPADHYPGIESDGGEE